MRLATHEYSVRPAAWAAGCFAAALSLPACAGPPDLGPRPQPLPATAVATQRSLGTGVGEGAWPRADWWRAVGDAQLTGLIEEALARSPDLAASRARLARARGLAQQSGAGIGPSLDLNASAALAKQSYNNGFPAEFVPKGYQDVGRATLDFGWDLDLWGGRRARLRAGLSDAQAAAVEDEAARLLLATSVASAYAGFAQLYADRDVAAAAVEVRRHSAALVAQRVREGLDTRAEVKQSEAAAEMARAELAALDEAIALRRNQLAALVGAGPDRGLDLARPSPTVLAVRPPAGDLALNLVGRRPDVVAARLRVEGAAKRIDAAHAAFYPNVNLSAFVGLQSLGLDQLFKSGSHIGNVGPALSLPIFAGNERKGGYRVARADYDAAVADYDRTLLQAAREVADAVASQRALQPRLQSTQAALAAAHEAHQLAQLRYRGGLATYLSVLSAEESMLSARRAVADLQVRAFALEVELVRALGGGFSG